MMCCQHLVVVYRGSGCATTCINPQLKAICAASHDQEHDSCGQKLKSVVIYVFSTILSNLIVLKTKLGVTSCLQFMYIHVHTYIESILATRP